MLHDYKVYINVLNSIQRAINLPFIRKHLVSYPSLFDRVLGRSLQGRDPKDRPKTDGHETMTTCNSVKALVAQRALV